MEILKKFNKFGEYYEKRATMKMGKHKYSIRSHSLSGRKWSEWKLYRKQMISMLRNTDVKDWEYMQVYEFDGMVDGIVYAERKWEELTTNMKEEIIKRLKMSKYRIGFDERDKVFRIWLHGVDSFKLRYKGEVEVV